MFLPFDRMKAVQASAVVADAEGGRISKLRLLKLLYIADRHALEKTGRPLLGAKTVAMDHGPLHSGLLDMINGTLPNPREWNRCFERVNSREIVRTAPSDNSSLSRYEIELLLDVVAQHEGFNDWELSEITHGFAEWNKNYTEGTSTVIPLEDIIDAVGRSEDKQSILDDLNDDKAFDKFFDQCASA